MSKSSPALFDSGEIDPEALRERLAELQGENEALEQLVQDLRGQLAQAAQERDTIVTGLRQQLKRLEQRLEQALEQQSRSQAASERLGRVQK